MSRLIKVLVSAYACEPGKGSEPEVGWRGSKAISKYNYVTVLTRTNNRFAIESLNSESDARKYRYFDLPKSLLQLKRRLGVTLGYYCAWHAAVTIALRKDLANHDIVHHLTFNAFQLPGFWWFSKPCVVLGPLGGGQICPWRLLPFFRAQAFKELVRSLTVILSRFNPLLLISLYFAKVILVANRDTERRLPRFARIKVRKLLETAIDTTCTSPLPEPELSRIRFLLLGRLEKRKGGELVLRALVKAVQTTPDISLTIAGSGPDESFLQRLSVKLGVEPHVEFIGYVHRESLSALFASHHVLIFPSLRDTSGNVVLEAMSYGRPVIALRHHGVAEIASDATAILVEPRNIQQTIAQFAAAITTLGSNPGLRTTMGVAGLQRVRSVFNWDRYSEVVSDAYRDAISPKTPKN